MKTIIPKAFYDKLIEEGYDKERLDTHYAYSGDLQVAPKVREHPFKHFIR